MKILFIVLVFSVSYMLFFEYMRYRCANPNSIECKMMRGYYA